MIERGQEGFEGSSLYEYKCGGKPCKMKDLGLLKGQKKDKNKSKNKVDEDKNCINTVFWD